MSLPPDVQAAKDRMEKAEAAAHADVESDEPRNTERRIELFEELRIAMDDYIQKVSRLRQAESHSQASEVG
jgi:hypothetical protein